MTIRSAEPRDLEALLALYTQLGDNPLPQRTAQLEALYAGMLDNPRQHLLLAEIDGRAVGTVMLLIVDNLTHAQRPFALVENVVTDAAHRGRGIATALLNAARERARAAGCYKIMLLTGSKRESTLNFYRRAGYNDRDKTAFIQWL